MRRRRQEEHDNADRWVISYADFITLLFAFFTTMYAISHVDLGKLDRFAGSMRSAFRTTGAADTRSHVIEGIRPPREGDARVEQEVRSAVEHFLARGDIAFARDERGVVLSIGDSTLFEAGSANIREEARPFLLSIAGVLKKTLASAVIEGHTDTIPIRSDRYPSNWELSTARATSILVQILAADQAVDPRRLSAAGYGEYRPVASNATPDGRAKNRRVDIVFTGQDRGI